LGWQLAQYTYCGTFWLLSYVVIDHILEVYLQLGDISVMGQNVCSLPSASNTGNMHTQTEKINHVPPYKLVFEI
jgi:hypothetical protein